MAPVALAARLLQAWLGRDGLRHQFPHGLLSQAVQGQPPRPGCLDHGDQPVQLRHPRGRPQAPDEGYRQIRQAPSQRGQRQQAGWIGPLQVIDANHQRPGLLQFLGPADRHLHAPAAGVRQRFSQQPRLADPGLALDQHDRWLARRGPVQGLTQDRDLRRTPAEAKRRRHGAHQPDATGHHRGTTAGRQSAAGLRTARQAGARRAGHLVQRLQQPQPAGEPDLPSCHRAVSLPGTGHDPETAGRWLDLVQNYADLHRPIVQSAGPPLHRPAGRCLTRVGLRSCLE